MAITLDVITRVTEASLRGTSKQIQNKMTQTGEESGQGFAKGFSQGVQKSAGDIQKATDKVADVLGQLKVAQQKQNELMAKGASSSQLIAQQERINKLTRDHKRALDDATDSVKRHTADAVTGMDNVNRSATGVLRVLSNLTAGTRFGGLTAETANMAAGFTQAGAAVGRFGASFAAAGLIGGGTVVLGLAAATAGVVALTNQLYDLGREWDDTFDSIIAKTGATGDVLQQIKDSVNAVAGEVPSSLGAIGDVAAAVAQNLKLVGPGADDIIKSLAVLKNNGYDVNIHDLGMAFRALDVDQNDYHSTLEQFLGLSQRTGVSIDSITSAIGTNAGALKEFGFTAGEVVTLMDMFDKAGIDADKGIGALGKAFKALTDAGLEPTKDNLQAVFDEINGMIASGQIAQANEQLNTLFGARGGGLAWADLIKEGKLNLNDLANATEAPRSSIKAMEDATYDFSDRWQMAINDAKVALAPLADTVFDFVNDGLDAIVRWVSEHKQEIIDFFISVGDVVIDVTKSIAGFVGSTLKDFGLIIDVVSSVIGGMATFDEFLNKIPGMGGNEQEIEKLRGWQDTLNGLSDSLKGTGEAIAGTEDQWNDIKNKWRDAGEAAKDAAGGIQDQADATQSQADANKSLEDSLIGLQGVGPVPGFTTGTGPGLVGPSIGPGGMQKFAANRYEPGMVPNNRKLMDAVSQFFPGLKAAADTGRRDSFGEHGAGEALDVSVNPGNQLGIKTPEGQITGNQVNQWMLQNADKLGIQYTIWQGKQWNPDGTTAPNSGQGITGGHWDHVHARVKPGPAGGMQRFAGSDAGIMPPYSGAGMMNYGPDGTPSPIPGIEPGPVGSTFGYNEYGEPGYYRPDSKSISSAEKSASKAEERVTKAQERLNDIQSEINDLEQKRTILNAQDTDKKIAALTEQLKDAQSSLDDAKESAADAQQNLDDARRGRFTQGRESRASRSGGMGQIGADLADDFGISGGLPGMAEWLTKFLANLAFAPMLGQLSAISAASPFQGGYGMVGVGGAQAMAANGGSLFPQVGLTGAVTPGVPAVPGVPPTIGPAPLGGGVGSPHLTGATPGPTVTPNTSMAPSAAPGGGGFTGLGGLPLAGLQTAAAGIDMLAPGAGQAAQTGIQLANRAIGYMGQVAGIGVGGLMETLLPHNSPLADPGKSWVGRIAAGFAGARPALPNQAGGAGDPARAQTPQEAAALQQQNGGGQGPLVNIENMVNQTPDGGQQVANQIGRAQAVAYASGGPR